MSENTPRLDPEYEKLLAERARQESETRAETPPVEEPQDTGTVSMDAVQRMIDQALERQQKQHAKEMRKLERQLTVATAALPLSLTPEHAGGVGTGEPAESWSQYDQELAQAGLHPHQNGESADWLAHPDDVEERKNGRVTTKLRLSTLPRDEDDDEDE